MENGGLTLRLYRLSDLPMLHSLFTPEIPLGGSRFRPRVSSLLSFYRWLKTTFQLVYVIEDEDDTGHEILGFVGFYNMNLGQSLWLSLTIFDPRDRGRGYGTRALDLVLDLLKRNGAVQTVYAEVLETNITSLCFLTKLGFEVSRRYEDCFTLEKVIGKM